MHKWGVMENGAKIKLLVLRKEACAQGTRQGINFEAAKDWQTKLPKEGGFVWIELSQYAKDEAGMDTQIMSSKEECAAGVTE